MFGGFGWTEGLVILVLVLLLFGGRKIPQLAKDLGSGIREFKKSISGTRPELEDDSEYDEDVVQKPARKKKRRSKS